MWRWLERLEDIDPSFWESLVLAHPRPSPFLTPAFLLPWARHFAGPLRLGLWREQGLILLHLGPDGWELLGGQEVADRLDGLSPDPDFWSSLRSLARAWDTPTRLQNLAEDAWGWMSRQPEDVPEVTDQAPHVPLCADFDTYLQGLLPKPRHELQRKMRRAERLCRQALRRTRGLADLPTFLRLQQLSSPAKAEFQQRPHMLAFLQDLAESLEAAGMLQLDTLWDGDEPLASCFCIRYRGVLHLYNSGFDPARSELAPGVVLLGWCLRQACRDGFREFDLLRGTERYKYGLGGVDRPVFRLHWTT